MGLTLGGISLSISSHFPMRGKSMKVKPVMLPPGRDNDFTKPCPTGSLTTLNTIGIVSVALFCGGNDRRAAAGYQGRCGTHQLRRVCLDSVQIAAGISMLDSDIA